MLRQKIPKVSVCVLAYNHEHYIQQCLQSIVEQKVDFDFEVIVGADYSTDSTQSIVRTFADRYPELVSVKLHEENIGGTKNYLATHALASGDFAAHIDGDDMMLPGKLQLQAHYLIDNPEIVAVWHRMRTIIGDGPELDPTPVTMIEPVAQRNVLQRGFAAHHSSLMYRRAQKPALGSSGEILDLQISVELLKNGGGVILPDVLGVYRKGVGTMANNSEGVRRLVKDLLDYYLGVYPEYRREINRCAFSLFILEIGTGGRNSMGFMHTFLISLNMKTLQSVASECLLLIQKGFVRLFSSIGLGQ